MPYEWRVRTSQPLDANVGLIDGGPFSKNSVALALNFAGGSRPIKTAGKSLAWSGSTSATTAGTLQGVGLYDPSTSSGLVYGAARSFDGFSPANSPCFFALSFVYGAYVNQGSGANVLWTYGGSGGSGFYVRSSSTNVLTVQFVNTTLTTPALVAGKSYHLVGGRDAAGNCWLWLNNALVASGTGATGADSASSNSMRFLDDGAGNRTFKGSLSGFILSSADPRYFGKELSANPWQAYEPELVWVPVSAGGAFTPSITEAITLADTASLVASLSASITEAATLSHSQDAIVGYAVSNTETLNLSHSQTNVANFPATITEAMTLADSGSVQFGATSTISEAMTLADSSSNVAALSASITESMTLADSPNASASGDFTATQTEAMSLADTASNAAALLGSITEAMSLADSQSNVASLSASISEPMTLADTASSSAAGDYTATITEAVTLSDSSSNIATLSATITESAALADTSTASSPGNFAASISESLALAEIASNQAALSAALVEALSLSDNAASAWSRVVALTEAMTLNDAASQTLNAIVTESAWWAYSVEPADLHYSVPAQDLTMSVEPQDLTFSIATLALAGR